MNYQTFKWPSHFSLEVLETSRGFTLSDYDKRHVEGLWHEETIARSSKLFNGQILNFVSFEENRMVGEFIDYKFYIAQLRDPGLEPLLQIAPISISGVTLAGNKILIGKRSSEVTQFRNCYECVPSGGIDPSSLSNQSILLEEQFRHELWEETLISVTEIKQIRPFAIIHDLITHHYELCAYIDVSYAIVQEERPPTEEYSELFWLSKTDVAAFLKKNSDAVMPLTQHLLQQIPKY